MSEATSARESQLNAPLFSPQVSQAVFQDMAVLAGKRMQPEEVGLLHIASYDPDSEYHDLNKVRFEVTPEIPDPLLRAMAELALHGFDAKRYELDIDNTPVTDQICQDMRSGLQATKERLAGGNRVMFMTGHKTRFEPAVAGVLLQTSMADSPQEQADLRLRTNLVIARYLTSFDLNLSALMGKPEAIIPKNVGWMVRQIGTMMLTFPATDNSRVLSGIDVGLQRAHNMPAKAAIDAIPAGDIGIIVGDGTMSKPNEDGVYPIHTIPAPTRTMIKGGWDLQPIASAHDVTEPFSVAGPLIPAEAVNDDAIHQSAQWIADTMTAHGVPASYARPV